MKMSLITLLLTTLASFAEPTKGIPSDSSTTVGNGGDILFCRARQPQLLDFYEAEEIYLWTIDMGESKRAPLEKVQFIINRIELIDPVRAQFYRQWANQFTQEARLKSGIEIIPIDDSHHRTVPRGCKVEQIAVQKEPKYPEEPRYIISQDLWLQVTRDNRAGLILHELIYRDGLQRGHKNSGDVRYLTGLLSSTSLSSMTPSQYALRLRLANFDYPFGWLDEDSQTFWFQHFHIRGYGESFKPTESCRLRGGQLPTYTHLENAAEGLRQALLKRDYVSQADPGNGDYLYVAPVEKQPEGVVIATLTKKSLRWSPVKNQNLDEALCIEIRE